MIVSCNVHGSSTYRLTCFRMSAVPTPSKPKYCLTHLRDSYSKPLGLTGDKFASKETIGFVWRYLWLSQLGVGHGM